MLLPPIKQRVRDSFERAAATYDQAAVVQRQVCDRLLDEFASSNRPFTHILDAGCGTGYGARLLRARWPSVHITGVDFAPSMLGIANRDTDACFADDDEAMCRQAFAPASGVDFDALLRDGFAHHSMVRYRSRFFGSGTSAPTQGSASVEHARPGYVHRIAPGVFHR